MLYIYKRICSVGVSTLKNITVKISGLGFDTPHLHKFTLNSMGMSGFDWVWIVILGIDTNINGEDFAEKAAALAEACYSTAPSLATC